MLMKNVCKNQFDQLKSCTSINFQNMSEKFSFILYIRKYFENKKQKKKIELLLLFRQLTFFGSVLLQYGWTHKMSSNMVDVVFT